MSNNKLKNMIDNHELDDFITNKELNNKLRTSKTFDEILELLKEYNYNESREALEVELMDLLKEFVDEEELSKVSGGKNNKKSFYNIITSLAVAGSLCMPVQGVTDVSNSEKVKNKKSSYSIGLPPKEKAGLGVCGIVGVGVLLGEVLRRTIFTRRNDNIENENNGTSDQISRDMTPALYEEMHDHFMKIATSPDKCRPEDFKKYALRELADYMLEEMIQWFRCMEDYCQVDQDEDYELDIETVIAQEEKQNDFVCRWNGSLRFLVCVHLAKISLNARLGKNKETELQACLNYINATRISTVLEKTQKQPKSWVIDANKIQKFGLTKPEAEKLSAKIEVNYGVIDRQMADTVLAYATNWGINHSQRIQPMVSEERLKKLEETLKDVTKYTESEGYKRIKNQIKEKKLEMSLLVTLPEVGEKCEPVDLTKD